jgi:signal transduction histidine kinase
MNRLFSQFFRSCGLHSIQGRLTAIALAFIVGTAVSVAVVGYRFTLNFENERYRDHFNLLAAYLAGNAELGVLLGNQRILRGLTDNMLNISDVQLVEIVDQRQQVILSKAKADPLLPLGYVSADIVSTAMEAGESLFFESDAAGQTLGQVRLGYSFAGLERLKQRLALGFTLLSLLLGMVPVIFYWQLSKAIRAPLQGVLEVAAEVTRGRMDVRAEGGSLIETITLARAFNDMLDALERQRLQLKQANEAVVRQRTLAEVGKFSMTVAHEIKNPLSIIKGSLAVLRKEPPPDQALTGQMFGFVDDEIARINKLIEDFLLFARPRPAAPQTISVRCLHDSLTHRLELMDSRVRVSGTLPAGLLEETLECDLFLIERALLNLVRNALEAAPPPAAVEVVFSCTHAWFTVRVYDHGPGIASVDLEQIFEPFFSRKAKGTGLGLAIAREVVKAHHGTLSAENCPAGGACFTLGLPIGRGQQKDEG